MLCVGLLLERLARVTLAIKAALTTSAVSITREKFAGWAEAMMNTASVSDKGGRQEDILGGAVITLSLRSTQG